MTGFGHDEFTLRAGENAGEFLFDVPQKAAQVVCGLFIADPQMGNFKGAAGENTPFIENVSKALLRSHVFDISLSAESEAQVLFSLADLEDVQYDWRCTAPGSKSLSAPSYPIVTSLRVACWAFDHTQVIAATLLRNVTASALPEVQLPLFDCFSRSQDDLSGRVCILNPNVGRCTRGRCLPERRPEDAGSAGATDGDVLDAGSVSADAPTEDAAIRLAVFSCSGVSEGTECQLEEEEAAVLGRCVASRCADQQIKAEPPLVVTSCTGPTGDATNGLNCFADYVQGYGTCFMGVCRLRCVSDADCSDSAKLIGEADTDYNCEHKVGGRLLTSRASYVGVCVRENEGP